MENEHYNANFGNMLTTLVMLGFMSNGYAGIYPIAGNGNLTGVTIYSEGWNGFMHDHTVDYPLCTRSNNFLFSDCGNPPWALFLFITCEAYLIDLLCIQGSETVLYREHHQHVHLRKHVHWCCR